MPPLSPLSEDDLEGLSFFEGIPWCATHIRDSAWSTYPTRSREPKSSTEDSFFAETLRGERTIQKCLTLCNTASLSSAPSKSTAAPAAGPSLPPIPAVKTFYALSSGLNGFPHVAHGGLLASLLDEEMGILLTVNQEFGSGGQGAPGSEINSMTLYMNVRYKAAVRTPGVVMGTAEYTKKEGRKTWIKAAVVDEEGTECAIAEAMFLEVPTARL